MTRGAAVWMCFRAKCGWKGRTLVLIIIQFTMFLFEVHFEPLTGALSPRVDFEKLFNYCFALFFDRIILFLFEIPVICGSNITEYFIKCSGMYKSFRNCPFSMKIWVYLLQIFRLSWPPHIFWMEMWLKCVVVILSRGKQSLKLIFSYSCFNFSLIDVRRACFFFFFVCYLFFN